MNFTGSHRPIAEALLDWGFEAARASSVLSRLFAHVRGLLAVGRAVILCGLSDCVSAEWIGWLVRLSGWWIVLGAVAITSMSQRLFTAETPIALRLLSSLLFAFSVLPSAAVLTSLTGRRRARTPVPAFTVISLASWTTWSAWFLSAGHRLSGTSTAVWNIAEMFLGGLIMIVLLLIAEETRVSRHRLRTITATATGFLVYFRGLHIVNSSSTERLVGVTTMRLMPPVYALLSICTIYWLLAAWNSRQELQESER